MTTPPFRFLSGLVATFLTSSLPVQAQCDYTRLPLHFAEVVSSARERVTKGELPALALAVAQHGSIVCEEAFGSANREKKIPATPQHSFCSRLSCEGSDRCSCVQAC